MRFMLNLPSDFRACVIYSHRLEKFSMVNEISLFIYDDVDDNKEDVGAE